MHTSPLAYRVADKSVAQEDAKQSGSDGSAMVLVYAVTFAT